ncbi:VOC family protein [Flavobacterium selenitireducens]|uniref:VOC family protein n=1 Tax=Flavobacterium selenitireducens TaxID=2722704 RepID=UPI001CC27A0C|nr:VOC family protein [Flavobacterium selenitireducens]
MIRPKSIRPFIGSKDFETSRRFYSELGFEETVLWQGFSVFKIGSFAFYLQDDYAKDWVENTQVFLEIEDVPAFWEHLVSLGLPSKFQNVKITAVREETWGRECFVHDPSGILWHFGEFRDL